MTKGIRLIISGQSGIFTVDKDEILPDLTLSLWIAISKILLRFTEWYQTHCMLSKNYGVAQTSFLSLNGYSASCPSK